MLLYRSLVIILSLTIGLVFCNTEKKDSDKVNIFIKYKSIISHENGIDITGVSIVTPEKDGSYILVENEYIGSMLTNNYHEMKANKDNLLPRRNFSIAEPLKGKLILVSNGKQEVLREIILQNSCLWPEGMPIPVEILEIYLYGKRNK